MSIVAHLLRVKDPSTGRPLEGNRLAREFQIIFIAGSETTGALPLPPLQTLNLKTLSLFKHPETQNPACSGSSLSAAQKRIKIQPFCSFASRQDTRVAECSCWKNPRMLIWLAPVES